MDPPLSGPGYEDDYVEKIFNETKSSTDEISPNHVCNADLSEGALEKVIRTVIPDLESIKLRTIGLMNTSINLNYGVKRHSRPESEFLLSLYQCETVSGATNFYRGSLSGYNNPQYLNPEPAKSAHIGLYAIGGWGGIQFVRDTVFVEIVDDSPCLKETEILRLAKALDGHLLAGKAETQRLKAIPSCILLSSEKISVPAIQEFTLKIKHDETHYALRDASIEFPDLVSPLGAGEYPGEQVFYACKEGVTRICLISIHNKTFHTSRSKPVEVTITPMDPKQEPQYFPSWKYRKAKESLTAASGGKIGSVNQ